MSTVPLSTLMAVICRAGPVMLPVRPLLKLGVNVQLVVSSVCPSSTRAVVVALVKPPLGTTPVLSAGMLML